MTRKSSLKYDYLIVGAGASATLLLMRMEKCGLLAGKKVGLLDSDFDSLRKKTFCFWAKPEEEIVRDCNVLIQKSWKGLRIDRGKVRNLAPLQYHYIPGSSMHQAMQDLIQRNGLDCHPCVVSTIQNQQDQVCVQTDKGEFLATHIFDSRPAGYKSPRAHEASVLQSFIGYIVEPSTLLADTDSLDMMDFGVAQQDFTQFMYVLPLSERKALVELTRFGAEKITAEEAIPVLQEYIRTHFGEVKILETETGCIPMCSAPLEVCEQEGVTNLGSRAGAVKPGTGYAFKNMYDHACSITRQLQNDVSPGVMSSSSRFRFYDRLLLWILCYKPEWGKPIFQRLFSRNQAAGILSFLDQKTSIWDDAGILLSLPFKPFLLALGHELNVRFKEIKKPLLLTSLAGLLCLFQVTMPSVYEPLQWTLLIAGFLVVGLPHGALDHLLESKELSGKATFSFIIKYLGIMLLYLILWKVLPALAFGVFMLYSAFHFGQSDMEEWKEDRFKDLKSWLWGVLLLGMILFPHMGEVAVIASGMGVELNMAINWGLYGFLFAVAGMGWGIFGKNKFMILSTAMLVLAMNLPVLSAFGIYFIGQHSINGWSHLRQGLQASSKSLFIKAFPFTLGALLLLVMAFFMAYFNWLPWSGDAWISVSFVFIACLSMPHVWAMHRFYSRSPHKL